MDLSEIMEQYEKQENLQRNEGSTGVKNLCKLLNAMGYKDTMYFGQFDQNGSYGDLINFLEDNSGCVEAIKEWIANENNDEWRENLESNLVETKCPCCGEPLQDDICQNTECES